MNWTLELVVVPVSDVDRAKAFYADQLGFNVDVDFSPDNDVFRVVQLTPPGSGCSISVGKGESFDLMEPGSLQGLHLIVPDIRAARAELIERGVEASEVQVFDETGATRTATEDDEIVDYGGFVFFNDPDGNGWVVQHVSARS